MKFFRISLRFGQVPAFFTALLFFGCASQKVTETNIDTRIPILQGATSKSETEIIVLLPKSAIGRFDVLAPSGVNDPPVGKPIVTEMPGSEEISWRLPIKGIKPGVDYTLEYSDANGKVIDRRTFRALDIDKRSVRFAFVSCMDDFYAEEAISMWETLAAKEPELLLFIGDNVYADRRSGESLGKSVNPELVWTRHVETRKALGIFRAPRLIPSLAVWDDHDYGMNDGDRTYPHRAKSLEVHKAFFGSKDLGATLRAGPGAASIFRGFGQAFVLLDDRSFRSPNQVPEVCRAYPDYRACKGRVVGRRDKDATHFGTEQELWLLRELRSLKVPAWIASGDQFFGGYHPFESFEGNHPGAFEKFLMKLRPLGRAYAFLSGDRHLTEIMRIEREALGFETYELTSSPIHAKTFPADWEILPNKRQLAGAFLTPNFMVVESDASEGALQAKASAYGAGGRLLFEREFRVSK